MVSDEKCLKFFYKFHFNKSLDFNNVKTFNEKLQWLKLYDRKPQYTRMVDKYQVRGYISETIGEKYLIPLLGVYENFDEINLNKLPKQFVIKCNHDSGGIVICQDKSKLDIIHARNKITKALKKNYYYSWREWPYKNVKPRIICEEFMVDKNNNELKDYKFMCFNGKVKCMFVCLNRNKSEGLNVDFYDTNWIPMPFERHYSRSNIEIEKPKNFNEMITLSEIVSKDIPFLRVDFYEINDKIYFGELTFFPGAGFEEFSPESYDEELGKWIVLPSKKTEA